MIALGKFLTNKRWIWFGGGFVVVLSFFIAFLEYEKRPATIDSTKMVVEITPGMSFSEIPSTLHRLGIIRSQAAFYWGALQKNAFRRIQAGEYELSSSMSVNEILEILIKGLVKRYELVVPEGFNIFDIATRLNDLGLCTSGAFLRLARDPVFLKENGVDADSLEGYLFPDTYWFVKKNPVEKIAETMVKRFWQIWNENGYAARARSKNLSVKDVLTLASIIEKETGIAEERPLVAAVFWNRLKKGMPLQADPTVIYGLLSEVTPFKTTITADDLHKLTPYNTYLIRGLPKGPICNPGKASIEAALSPADVNYLYFVAQPDGTHHFSSGLTEHNAAVYRYRNGIANQKNITDIK